MKPGDIVFHKATADPMVVVEVKEHESGPYLKLRYMSREENGAAHYELGHFGPFEFETFEERALRERDMQKFLFTLSHEQKGPQAVN